jgi:hypothetical protein
VSAFVALAAQVVAVDQKDTSLLEHLGEVGMSNNAGQKVVGVTPLTCESGGLNAEPILLAADINVRGVFRAWNELVGNAGDQLRPVNLDTSDLGAEGYLEMGDDVQRVVINVDPGESRLLHIGVVTQGGSVVRTRLRRLREASDEPIAIFVSGSTVEWWSREARGRINDAIPLGCTTLTVGAATGVASASGSVSAHLAVGDRALELRQQVNDYFRRFSAGGAVSVVSFMAQLTFVSTLAIIGWLRLRRMVGRKAPV